MKNCPDCRNTRLRKTFVFGNYKSYDCDTCEGIYQYCVICAELSGVSHESAHSMTLGYEENNFVVNTSSKHVIDYSFYIFRSLFSKNRQLYFLRLNNSISRKIFELYPTNEMFDEVTSIIFRGDYSCILCGMNYETFPSKMLVKLHMKSCERAKD